MESLGSEPLPRADGGGILGGADSCLPNRAGCRGVEKFRARSRAGGCPPEPEHTQTISVFFGIEESLARTGKGTGRVIFQREDLTNLLLTCAV
jgi:hypothetical protein